MFSPCVFFPYLMWVSGVSIVSGLVYLLCVILDLANPYVTNVLVCCLSSVSVNCVPMQSLDHKRNYIYTHVLSKAP